MNTGNAGPGLEYNRRYWIRVLSCAPPGTLVVCSAGGQRLPGCNQCQVTWDFRGMQETEGIREGEWVNRVLEDGLEMRKYMLTDKAYAVPRATDTPRQPTECLKEYMFERGNELQVSLPWSLCCSLTQFTREILCPALQTLFCSTVLFSDTLSCYLAPGRNHHPRSGANRTPTSCTLLRVSHRKSGVVQRTSREMLND